MVLLDSTAPASAPTGPIQTGSYDFLGRIAALLPAAAHSVRHALRSVLLQHRAAMLSERGARQRRDRPSHQELHRRAERVTGVMRSDPG
jgi:hypothetical protein